MDLLKNRSVAQKLSLLVAFFGIGLITLGGIAYVSLDRVKVNGPLYSEIVQGKDLVADILPPPAYILETYLVAFQLSNETDPTARRALVERCASLRNEYDSRHEYWQANLPSGPLQEALLVESRAPAVEFFDLLGKRFLPAIEAGNADEVRGLLTGPLKAAYDRHRAAIDETVTLANAKASETETRARAAVKSAVIWSPVAAGTALFCGIVFAIFIARSITKPLRDLFRGLTRFSTAELQQTGEQFNRIIDSMAEGVAQVTDAASQVSSASQELAAGASQQASSLEETSSALEEMSAMARSNATSSKEANELATQAHKDANAGETTMTGINEASDKISRIIKVIEEIAFQTNLLALNAAVEAARAGEHGKGFAVVAEEVRNLAQRAAAAAKETTTLIEDSVNKSREGKASVQAIVTGVAKVTELINGIARASDEQAQGVEQVNAAVAQMDKVTQQNAAGAEESASASEQLTAQAASTKALVDELMVLVRGAASQSAARTKTVSYRAPQRATVGAGPQSKKHDLSAPGWKATDQAAGTATATADEQIADF